jgi:nucleoid-associated protein YgaU
MKLVGWTSMVAVLIAGTAIAQVDEDQGAEGAKVEVPANMPQTHTVKDGDTLWDITQTYYGDPYRWPQVWSYNPEITNPHWI